MRYLAHYTTHTHTLSINSSYTDIKMYVDILKNRSGLSMLEKQRKGSNMRETKDAINNYERRSRCYSNYERTSGARKKDAVSDIRKQC